MKKVVHLTSVHNRYDNRILIKECSSLARNNYDVTLIVADGLGQEDFEQVKIIDLGKPKSRLLRMFMTVPQLCKLAFNQKADLYHFHDPELILVGLCLRILGRKVIYDIHEDYITGIKQKPYLNKYLASFLSFSFDYLERFVARFFHLIIAERYYAERFPKSIAVLNYPIIPDNYVDKSIEIHNLTEYDRCHVIYTGNVTLDRGALEHARVVADIPFFNLTSVGRCSSSLAEAMYNLAGEERLKIIGVDEFVNPDTINEAYLSRYWHAGIALFPKTAHYAKKELTKFFEYMKFGLPIICSDFPAWKEFIEEANCGFVVDPDDTERISEILNLLKNDNNLRRSLGENGKKLFFSKFNWSVEEVKLLNLYGSILR